MSQRRTVPVAYVTKWATTRGIVVVDRAQATDYSNGRPWLYVKARGVSVPSSQWTEDMFEAQRRWRKALERERARLKAKQAALTKALKDGPKWEET